MPRINKLGLEDLIVDFESFPQNDQNDCVVLVLGLYDVYHEDLFRKDRSYILNFPPKQYQLSWNELSCMDNYFRFERFARH